MNSKQAVNSEYCAELYQRGSYYMLTTQNMKRNICLRGSACVHAVYLQYQNLYRLYLALPAKYTLNIK